MRHPICGFLALCLVSCANTGQHILPPGATNRFSIQLQEGFSNGSKVVITVDGRVVYMGKPKTDPVLGLATAVSTGATSTHPVVTFAIPSRQINWSKQIDLSAGHAVGIGVTQSGLLEVRQAPKFDYE